MKRVSLGDRAAARAPRAAPEAPRAAPEAPRVAPEYRLGYVAQSLELGIGAGHTCRVANASPARLSALIATNLEELDRIFRFNAARGIHVFRIGSSLVPLASHPVNRVRWWKDFARDFDALARTARETDQRLSMHPSPAGASLASASPKVRAAALEELRYSAMVLDLLEQPPDARIIIHVGGAAPDRPTALAAAHRFLDRLPEDLRSRIAIEHDDRVWNAREVLPLAKAHGVPFVADILHNRVLPSTPTLDTRTLFRAAAATWRELGLRPKHHLASQSESAKPGAHAAYVTAADFEAALEAIDPGEDLMLEAKEKDRALLALRVLGEARSSRDTRSPSARASRPTNRW